jgi:HAE1 family hydrophobic/amphiphilic exporter-1
MTTLSVMAALLPIATGVEEGSELLVSVALVLIGGLLTSTLLTLVFVPAMYTIFDDIQRLVTRPFQRERAVPVSVLRVGEGELRVVPPETGLAPLEQRVNLRQ